MTKSTYGVPLDGTGRVVMADRARLRELAEAVESGTWAWASASKEPSAELRFMHAASPAVVLALLDALTQAEGELGRARDVLGLLAASQWNVGRL